MGIQVTPIKNSPFGAVITLPKGITDPSVLEENDFKELKKALLTNLIIVIPDQAELPASSQYELTKRFDPTCEGAYGHSKEFRHEKSVLRRDGKSVPSQPQVQILGQGTFDDYLGLDQVDLRHPTHRDFHKDVLSKEAQDDGYTRFYRWHIDSALYGLSPPLCTTLLGIHVPPSTKTQKIKYEDTQEEIEIAQAGTAFMSGAIAFDLLSDEDKKLALGTTVEYAPHPYIFISPARATTDGLTMVSDGKETPLDQLPEWEAAKVKKLPKCGRTPRPVGTTCKCTGAASTSCTGRTAVLSSSRRRARRCTECCGRRLRLRTFMCTTGRAETWLFSIIRGCCIV